MEPSTDTMESCTREARGFNGSVVLRDMELSDIPRFVQYWYRSPKEFLLGMGVNPGKMKPEAEFSTYLESVVRENSEKAKSKLPFLSIVRDGRVVGSHSVGDVIEGESAIFHAHLWHPEIRGIGLCTYTYPLATKIFMDRFGLREMLFKTPSLNAGANRIKEKLGLKCVGEEPISYPFMLEGLTAKVYRLDRPALKTLLAKVSGMRNS